MFVSASISSRNVHAHGCMCLIESSSSSGSSKQTTGIQGTCMDQCEWFHSGCNLSLSYRLFGFREYVIVK